MTTSIAIGANSHTEELLWNSLQQLGVQRALPSRREKFTPQKIQQLLALPKRHMAKLGADLVADLYLGNMDQSWWGWSMLSTAGGIDLWTDFDPDIKFALGYESPWDFVCRMLEATPCKTQTLLNEWLNNWSLNHKSLCDFYYRYPSSAVLVNAAVFHRNAGSYANGLSDAWGLEVLSESPGSFNKPHQSAEHIKGVYFQMLFQLVQQHQESRNLYAELEALSLVPTPAVLAVAPEPVQLWEALATAQDSLVAAGKVLDATTAELMGNAQLHQEQILALHQANQQALDQVSQAESITQTEQTLKVQALQLAQDTKQQLVDLQSRFEYLQQTSIDMLLQIDEVQKHLESEAAEHHSLKQAHGGYIVSQTELTQHLQVQLQEKQSAYDHLQASYHELQKQLEAEAAEHLALKQAHGGYIVSQTELTQHLQAQLQEKQSAHDHLQAAYHELQKQLEAEAAEHLALKQAHGGYIVSQTVLTQELRAQLQDEELAKGELHARLEDTRNQLDLRSADLAAYQLAQSEAADRQAEDLALSRKAEKFLQQQLTTAQSKIQNYIADLSSAESARKKLLVQLYEAEQKGQDNRDHTAVQLGFQHALQFWRQATVSDIWIDPQTISTIGSNWVQVSAARCSSGPAQETSISLPALAPARYTLIFGFAQPTEPEAVADLDLCAVLPDGQILPIELVHEFEAAESATSFSSMGQIDLPPLTGVWQLVFRVKHVSYADYPENVDIHGGEHGICLTGLRLLMVDPATTQLD
jgi:hypothetical protein